jgi:hypothetical protein
MIMMIVMIVMTVMIVIVMFRRGTCMQKRAQGLCNSGPNTRGLCGTRIGESVVWPANWLCGPQIDCVACEKVNRYVDYESLMWPANR